MTDQKDRKISVNQEYVLTADDLVVSKTDLHGNITFINDDFVGKPHSIVRHLDMPREAFLDLWGTLKSQRTWIGIVKNKTQSGGFYWVRARVSPIYDNANIIGYMSVRCKPNVDELENAITLYETIKKGQFKDKLHGGNVVKTGFFSIALRKFVNIKIQTQQRFFIVLALLALLPQGLLNHFTSNDKDTVIISLSILLTVSSSIAAYLFAKILKPIHQATDAINAITEGNYQVTIDNSSSNEIGMMVEKIRMMSIRLGFDIAEDKKLAAQNLRIKIGLDNVDTSVVIADENRKIIYLNKAANKLLTSAEADIRQDLPHFQVDNLFGTNIDTFHKNATHQMQLLDNLTQTIAANTLIGGHHMVVKASPIINDYGHRLGSVAEWMDRSVEVNMEQEIARIVDDAVQGRFSNRLNLLDKRGFFKEISQGLNELLDVCHKGFQDVREIFAAINRGDLTQQITNDYDGEFDHLKQDANHAMTQLTNIIEQIKVACEMINQGIHDITVGNQELASRTENQVVNLESTATATHELTSTMQKNDGNAKLASESVNSVLCVVDSGVKIIGNVVTTMREIKESSQRIVDIIAVIDGIAFQTNILEPVW